MEISGTTVRGSSNGKAKDLIHADIFDYIDESKKVTTDKPVNAMSVDVEEHFQVSAFEKQIKLSQWDDIPSRIVRNMDRILQKFDDHNTKATFFTLGWVAERAPKLIKTIVAEGHEIASHGYNHSRVWTQTPDEFREDVTRTKKILEDVACEAVIGYRAPSFSISQRTEWAHEILHESGYQYSSSIYPIKHDHYGLPSAPRFPFRIANRGILEIPLTTSSIAGLNLPGAGGGYFRLLPLAYSRWILRRVNTNENMPGVFYFHPWEIDPDQPRIDGISLATRFRHYVNLGRFEGRLEKLLREFSWARIDSVFHDAIAAE